jgi:hypothetical protein
MPPLTVPVTSLRFLETVFNLFESAVTRLLSFWIGVLFDFAADATLGRTTNDETSATATATINARR